MASSDTPKGAAVLPPLEPQWLRLGRDAAARALYEAWHPTRTDTDFPEGAPSWAELNPVERQRYFDAAERACEAFHYSTLRSAERDVRSFFGLVRRG